MSSLQSALCTPLAAATEEVKGSAVEVEAAAATAGEATVVEEAVERLKLATRSAARLP